MRCLTLTAHYNMLIHTCADVCREPGLNCRVTSTAPFASWVPMKTKKQAMASPVRPRPAWQCTAILRRSTVVTYAITCSTGRGGGQQPN